MKEKKEIGMGKLIESLKDQYGEVVTYNIQSDGGYMFHICGFAVREERLLSKKFGFIKRLVENDKIDFSLIPNKIKEIGIPMKINGEIKYGFDSSDYYWLLMLLSISSSPIEDLISYLK